MSGKGKAIINVLVTADRISSRINGALKPLGISKEQYNVLRILRGQRPNPCALQVVSERMISQSSNASRLVDKLVSRGLVERRLCECNRRRVDILITEPGLHLLAGADEKLAVLDDGYGPITNKEAETLSALLDKLRG